MAEYISKDSAISIFNAKAEIGVCTPAQPYFAKAAKMIELLPAADVAPVVHGRWVSDKDDILFHCSVCETQVSTDWDYDDLSWNYCPNCGARMDLEEQNGKSKTVWYVPQGDSE